ncbi:MAG: phytochelatin synthase family protein [Panacagrimonas sp.]
MLRRWKFLALAVAIILTAGVSGAGWFGFSAPPVDHLALPRLLVDATSAEGRALLRSATPFSVDHGQLLPYFVPQSRRAYCGIATSTMVVNALRHPQPLLSQSTIFTPEVSALRSATAVSFSGLSLEQLGDLLRAEGLAVRVVHAANTDLDSFRGAARAVLAEPSEYLIVNYDRATLEQQGSGHISPVTAYHADSDRFLVLDVAAHKYPPTWVPATELWNAMQTVDPSSGQSRGFLLVREAGARSGVTADAPAFARTH